MSMFTVCSHRYARASLNNGGEMDKVLLRFPDLPRYGINNWTTLARRIRDDGAPTGFYLRKNSGAWYKDDWDNWLANRPKRTHRLK